MGAVKLALCRKMTTHDCLLQVLEMLLLLPCNWVEVPFCACNMHTEAEVNIILN